MSTTNRCLYCGTQDCECAAIMAQIESDRERLDGLASRLSCLSPTDSPEDVVTDLCPWCAEQTAQGICQTCDTRTLTRQLRESAEVVMLLKGDPLEPMTCSDIYQDAEKTTAHKVVPYADYILLTRQSKVVRVDKNLNAGDLRSIHNVLALHEIAPGRVLMGADLDAWKERAEQADELDCPDEREGS